MPRRSLGFFNSVRNMFLTLDRRHEIYKTSNAVLLKDHQYDCCSLASYAFKKILREPRRMMSEGVIGYQVSYLCFAKARNTSNN